MSVRVKATPKSATAESSITRCAVYCRVSNDDGLSQAFTSLDAQRASGEAFIAARKDMGWVCIDEKFEDGGYSGGNMDRPALQRLLQMIEAGKVNAVVCYKLDRVTRSIRDFGKLADVFEKHNVALISVTQSIDTGTSMGRLMMHVLLSFAAFERELASERTRDKIAMSRQRGRWTGGRPPLGYDVVETTLVVNPAEAAIVQALYSKYLELGSLSKTIEWAQSKNITNKAWTTHAGHSKGGSAFFKSTLSQLLSNPIYIGKISHKGKVYDGLHIGIIDPAVFARVQELLAENGACGVSLKRNRYGGLLKGLISCGCCGGPMAHTITTKKSDSAGAGTEYRYYACLKKQAHGSGRCKGRPVQAEQIESFVMEKVRSAFSDPALVTLVLDAARARSEARLRDLDARRIALAAEHASVKARVDAGESASAFTRTLDEIERDMASLELEHAEVAASLIDRHTVQRGLKQFDAVWASLAPSEKARILALTVKQVRFDAVAGTVEIDVHEDSAQKEVAA
jgi:site-specific DNA recombinase